ncbi:MAG TPA: ATP-binding protein [Planctomycetota bacterium]|nr:ATP-binding protein [Planctomycetota bacterium]
MNVDQALLQHGFEQFTVAARELERSYAELKQRAEHIDLELQATNRALHQSLQEREAIFSALPLGLVTVRADGAATCCNREAERLCAAAAAVGVELASHAPGEVVIGQGLVRIRRVGLPDGDLVVLEDRSQVQELEREVHRLDRLAGLSELALGIAHEIKNPLNGVMGFAELLERCEDREAARRFAAKVAAGMRQVDAIVTSLLGFARPDRARVRTTTVAEIVADAATAASLPSTRVQLLGARHLRADADALGRVLGNLFRNALEASPQVIVRVEAAARHGRLELIVQDDGPGVPAQLGGTAFEPFVSTKERGTGLGLPLSVRVLSYLGGDLELLNPGEPGARFRVRLPLLESTPAEAGVPA